VLELGKHVSSGHVDTGDRFGRDDDSPHQSRRFRNDVEDSLVEELSVGKEERRGPTK